MSRVLKRATVAAIAALAVAPGSALAGDWRPQQKLTAAGAEPQVAMLPGGEATVAWAAHAPTAGEAGGVGAMAVLRPRGGSFGAPIQLSPGGAVGARIVIGPAGHELVYWANSSFHSEASMRPPGGSFGPVLELPAAGEGSIGLDAAGRIYILASLPGDAQEDTRLGVYTLAPDGSVESLREVAHQRWTLGATLHVDAGGMVTVAWRGMLEGEGPNDSHAYTATAAPGAPFDQQVVSGPYYDDNASGAATRTVGDARGDVLVVWPQAMGSAPTGAAPPGVMPSTLYASFKPAGGRFGPAERISNRADARSIYRWHAAIGPRGEALVAWTDIVRVAMAYRPPSGPFEPTRTAGYYPAWGPDDSYAGQGEPDVAFSPTGDAAVLYAVNGVRNRSIEAIRRPAGGHFELPQEVSDVRPVNDPVVALAGDSDAIAAWSPQPRMSWSPSDRDSGIYAAVYDADAPPRIEHAALRRHAGAVALEASESGLARVVVTRGGRRVLARQRSVVPGENAVHLSVADRRALSRRGSYVARVTLRDRAGRLSKARRLRFGALR